LRKRPIEMSQPPLRLIVLARDQSSRVQDAWQELAEFLAFDFSVGAIPKFREDWCLEDPLEAVLSTCSTLITLAKVNDMFATNQEVVAEMNKIGAMRKILSDSLYQEQSE